MPHADGTDHPQIHNLSGNLLQRPTIRFCLSVFLTRHTRCQNEEPPRTQASLRLGAMKFLAPQDRKSPSLALSYSRSQTLRRSYSAKQEFDRRSAVRLYRIFVGVHCVVNPAIPAAVMRTQPVGVYDLHGNAWQWCADWYGAEYYARSPADDPTGPDTGDDRVLRGGSWYFGPRSSRSASRGGYAPYCRDDFTGFRVARNQ